MKYYARQDDKRRKKFNTKMATKSIKEGALVLRYDNRFDYNKGASIKEGALVLRAMTTGLTTTSVTSSYHIGKDHSKCWRIFKVMEATN